MSSAGDFDRLKNRKSLAPLLRLRFTPVLDRPRDAYVVANGKRDIIFRCCGVSSWECLWFPRDAIFRRGMLVCLSSGGWAAGRALVGGALSAREVPPAPLPRLCKVLMATPGANTAGKGLRPGVLPLGNAVRRSSSLPACRGVLAAVVVGTFTDEEESGSFAVRSAVVVSFG